MIIGFIGFGEVASTLTQKLSSNEDINILTSTFERSEKTKELIDNSEVTVVEDYKKVAKLSDILISTVTPYESINVAKKYASLAKGIFLDLNNISPISTLEIADFLNNANDNHNDPFNNDYSNNFYYSGENPDNFVKGAIIGKISATNSVIYLSGENADKLAILNDYGLNVKIIGKTVEKASYIKMLRSIYTKGVTAITYEAFVTAESLDLTGELLEVLNITEGENFQNQTISRLNSLANSHERKFQEMNEILEFLEYIQSKEDFEYNTTIIRAVKDKFKDI